MVLGAALSNPSSSHAANQCSLPDRLSTLGQNVSYDGASLGFDGTYLDYTENGTYTTGPNSGKRAAAGFNRVYTIDPQTCEWRGKPVYQIPAGLTGNTEVELYQVTYDPRYQFANGDLGAILARTGQNLNISIPSTAAAVFAIDPLTGTSELAFYIPCSAFGNTCQAEPSLFTYDFARDQIWVSLPTDSQDPNANQFIPTLVSVPAHRGNVPAVVDLAHQTCFYVPSGPSPADGVATWAVGGNKTLYMQMEDNTTVRHVSSLTCASVGADIQHSAYGEADQTENDQMVCDSVSFGGGTGDTSVLWLRDKAMRVVQNYGIDPGACPYPTTLTLTQPSMSTPISAPVTECAVLRKYSNGRPPLAGMNLSFALAQRPIGSAVTRADGTGCLTFQAPATGGTLPLTVTFGGTPALLSSQAFGTLGVIAPPPQAQQQNDVPQPGSIAPRPAPPPAAPVQQLSIGQQVQAQSQVQAQTQVQLQPGMSMDQEQQVQLTVQGLNGDRRSSGLSAVARDPSPAVVLLIQLTAGLLMGIALLQRDRILEVRRLVRPARDRR
ncbi:MAG TPA: hypothetical protein VNV65_06015 [Candidatus Solibacter sp.]|nr:hypothetical protein [Candidatus Solibacter sp.]